MKLDILIEKLENRLESTRDLSKREYDRHQFSSSSTRMETRDAYMECWGRVVELREILDMLKMARDIGSQQ